MGLMVDYSILTRRDVGVGFDLGGIISPYTYII